jgi:hypothetical protein
VMSAFFAAALVGPMRPAPLVAFIDDLVRHARDAGVKVYFKSNLFDGKAHILKLPLHTPIEPDPAEVALVFNS